MVNSFQHKSILVLEVENTISKSLIDVLDTIGFSDIDHAQKVDEALSVFENKRHDVIIGDIIDAKIDIIALCESLRAKGHNIPVLGVADSNTVIYAQAARNAKMTDMLQIPYSTDDLSNKLSHILSFNKEDLENITKTYSSSKDSEESYNAEDWPEKEEAVSLTSILLDHYLTHHEIVFAKLKMTHSATRKCIEDVRSTYEKVKERDNTNVLEFKDFDRMWEEVLALFAKGGLSEDHIYEIEKLITVIPKDIRRHYDAISQQDKSFLALVESLNSSAYKKAKEKVVTLQAQPNPFNQKTSNDYQSKENGMVIKSFMFQPKAKNAE